MTYTAPPVVPACCLLPTAYCALPTAQEPVHSKNTLSKMKGMVEEMNGPGYQYCGIAFIRTVEGGSF